MIILFLVKSVKIALCSRAHTFESFEEMWGDSGEDLSMAIYLHSILGGIDSRWPRLKSISKAPRGTAAYCDSPLMVEVVVVALVYCLVKVGTIKFGFGFVFKTIIQNKK